MKLLSRIAHTLTYGILVVALLLVCTFFAFPHIPGMGALDVKIVKSGSMEPTIMTGGIVLIHETSSYGLGDVITFKSETGDIPTTHRIIGTETAQDGSTVFVTKGDANEERDMNTVERGSVIGKVIFSLPYIGFILDFARHPLGFVLLVGIPALLIILDEIETIWREIRGRRASRNRRDVELEVPSLVVKPYVPPRVRMMDIRPIQPRAYRESLIIPRRTNSSTPRLDPAPWIASSVSVVALMLVLSSVFSFGQTISYLSDREGTLGNLLAAIAIGFTVTPSEANFTMVDTELGTPEGTLASTVNLEPMSVPLVYDLNVEFATGSIPLCDAVVASTNDLGAPYSGSLMALTGNAVPLSGTWNLELDLAPGVYEPNATCAVDLVYGGWNALQDVPIAYEDTERTRVIITAPSTVTENVPLIAAFALDSFVVPPSDAALGTTTDSASEDGTSNESAEPPPEDIRGEEGVEQPPSEDIDGTVEAEVSTAPADEEVVVEDGEAPIESEITEEPQPESEPEPVPEPVVEEIPSPTE